MSDSAPAAGTALAAMPARHGMLRPVAVPAEIIQVHAETSALITQVLKEGRDFGVIPGTGDKPTMLKPGAEKVVLAFGCVATYEVSAEIDHDRPVVWQKRQKKWANKHKGDREFEWVVQSGESFGLYSYTTHCKIIERDSGIVVGEGIGVCSTMESKYIDRPRDCQNTALKMSQKRALVAAVLNAFALSDQFTQDVEEAGRDGSEGEDAPADTVIRMPGDESKWDGHGGKPMTEVPVKTLAAFVRWCEKNPEVAARFAKAVDEARRVITGAQDEKRDAAEQSDAATDARNDTTTTETPRRPPVATNFDEPPPALAPEDDDLPF